MASDIDVMCIVLWSGEVPSIMYTLGSIVKSTHLKEIYRPQMNLPKSLVLRLYFYIFLFLYFTQFIKKQVLRWHLQRPEPHQSSLLNRSWSVSQLVARAKQWSDSSPNKIIFVLSIHGMARYHWHHAKPSPSLISPAAAAGSKCSVVTVSQSQQ